MSGALLIASAASIPRTEVGFAQSAIDSQVRSASLNRSTSPGPAATVRFGRRASQVGDVVEQTISHEVLLTTVERRGNQIADTSTKTAHNHQRRTVSTTRVDQGRAVTVQVKYLEAGKRLVEGEDPVAAPQIDALPIAGKTYACQRVGEKLVVLDDQGRVPPPLELELVIADMEAIGRVNPLAEFMNGRVVAVGETLRVPLELADRLLGLRPEFGKLTRFDLTLREAQYVEGARCAVFHASIEATSRDSSQLHLQVAGPMVVEIDTCRAVRSQLTGPIAMSESRGSYSAAYQLISTGKLSLSLTSDYRDAAR